MKFENFEKAIMLVKHIREYETQLKALNTAYDVRIGCHTSIVISLGDENNSPLKHIAETFVEKIEETIEIQLTSLYLKLEEL